METYVGSGTEYGKQKVAVMLDLTNPSSQVNMGNRWVVDVGYKDGYEYWSVDIGPYDAQNPTIVNVAPEFGVVRYYRDDPYDPDSETYSEFSNIQNSWTRFSNRCP